MGVIHPVFQPLLQQQQCLLHQCKLLNEQLNSLRLVGCVQIYAAEGLVDEGLVGAVVLQQLLPEAAGRCIRLTTAHFEL